MNHNDFQTLLKQNSHSGAYLFHGGEEFVKDGLFRALLQTLEESTRELNVQTFESADFQTLYAACETLPFFAEKRVVVCRSLPVEDNAKKLAAYLPGIPESTVLLFFIRGKAADNLTLVKALKAAGREVLFSELSVSEAMRWLMQRAKKLKVSLDEGMARRLISLVGTDMTALAGEFEKAAAYAGENNAITQETLDAAVTASLESDVFRIFNLIVDGQKSAGFLALKKLLDAGQNPMGLAALFSKRMQTVLKTRALIDKGLKRAEAAKALGQSPMIAQKNYDAALRYTYARAAEISKAFADVGYLNNSGTLKDVQALERAFFMYFVQDERINKNN